MPTTPNHHPDLPSHGGVQPSSHPQVCLMGVSASGKTTLARALADALHATFLDADDLHSPQARAAMQSGTPLTDNDRYPWLDRVATAIRAQSVKPVVLACSALKRAYRDRLRATNPNLRFIHLSVPIGVAEQRMAERRRADPAGSIPPELAQSQFEAMEPAQPAEGAMVVDGTRPVEELVREICSWLEISPLDRG